MRLLQHTFNVRGTCSSYARGRKNMVLTKPCPLPVEFTGFEEVSGTVSLPRESNRIWRGSYKGKDWRYLVCFTC